MSFAPITFSIPYTMCAKQADRSRIAHMGGKQFIRHYQSKEVTENAQALASFVAPHRPPAPLGGPIRLDVLVIFPWLKGHSAKVRSNGGIPKETKPDVDNILKQLDDVLERSGFFGNDAQVSDVRVRKRFGAMPTVQVRIEEDHGDHFAGPGK